MQNWMAMAEKAQADIDSAPVHQSKKGRQQALARHLQNAYEIGVDAARRGQKMTELLAGLPLSQETTDLIAGLRAEIARLKEGGV